MPKRSPIVVFSEWAKTGKDQGMAKGHASAVSQMLEWVLPKEAPFSLLDAGCGNGWVVRQVAQMKHCHRAEGVDGSAEMISKARAIDPSGTYHLADLEHWNPKTTFDFVHSMEVFYYLNDPLEMLTAIAKHWLSPGGRLIIGIDFYTENAVSHGWPEKIQVNKMQLFSENEWKNFFELAGFSNVQTKRIDEKEGWAGTLCLTGTT